jgi:tetratricopeptide (TPR) repeat protein
MARLILATIVLAHFSAAALADDRKTCQAESGNVAIEACNRVINSGRYRSDEVADAYINRGQEYYVKKEYDQAVEDATQAIRLNPKGSILAFGNRANALAMKGEHQRAIEDYTQAIKLDRNYAAAYTGRGLERQKIDDVRGAIADYKAALDAPAKYDDGRWAHDTARKRLKELE